MCLLYLEDKAMANAFKDYYHMTSFNPLQSHEWGPCTGGNGHREGR